METTDRVTEDSPLKATEDGIEAVTPTEVQNKSCKEGLGFSKMGHWRTAAFFFSLFLCLTVVFAFSFILPCPVRPQYDPVWSRNFSEAATYDFLGVENANGDKVIDILLVIRSPESSPNRTCADAGLSSPCLFMLALDGTKGEMLWERPLGAELDWAQCGLQAEAGRAWHCLLSHADNLTAVSKHTGEVIWQQPRPTSLRSSLPVLSIPNLDGDGVGDLALVASDDSQTQLVLLSGKTGAQIGSTVVIDSIATNNHLLHRTKDGSYYVLLQSDSGVYGLALWKVAAKAKLTPDPGLKKDKHLEEEASNVTGLVLIYHSSFRSAAGRLLRTKDSDDSSDILVVSDTEVALVNGSALKLRWRFNTSSIIGIPSFGHFNKDNVLDIVVEDELGNSSKQITILDGRTGASLWALELVAGADSPRPDAVHTINSVSVFMFWGSVPSEANSSESTAGTQHSYMLHPLFPDYLLESKHAVDHVVVFRATLMENGRHAAYFLLTGPEKAAGEGTVVFTKRKLKQDISPSVVRRIGGGEMLGDDELKEAFNRLRFSSDW